jgi:hypothetical protein
MLSFTSLSTFDKIYISSKALRYCDHFEQIIVKEHSHVEDNSNSNEANLSVERKKKQESHENHEVDCSNDEGLEKTSSELKPRRGSLIGTATEGMALQFSMSSVISKCYFFCFTTWSNCLNRI